MAVVYICENGHERDTHKSQPEGHGSKPVCYECKSDIVTRQVDYRKCLDCGHGWPYTGDSERVTCPNCRGKRTEPVEVKDDTEQ